MTYTPEQIKANIQAVIDWLESPAAQDEFDMQVWDCGTAMCIGGFIDANFFDGNGDGDICGRAIGLSGVASKNLFAMSKTLRIFDDATPEIAAQCMRNLRDYGVVDWDRAFHEVEGNS